jgi:WD40 repeat protein
MPRGEFRSMVQALPGATNSVFSVAFSVDGKTLVAATRDAMRRWQVATGRLLGKPMPGGGSSAVLSPDGRMLNLATWDGTVQLWDVAIGERAGDLRHTGPVWTVAFGPAGKLLASASGNRRLIVRWESRCKDRWVPCGRLAFSPNGKTLASGSSENTTLGSTCRGWPLHKSDSLARSRSMRPYARGEAMYFPGAPASCQIELA